MQGFECSFTTTETPLYATDTPTAVKIDRERERKREGEREGLTRHHEQVYWVSAVFAVITFFLGVGVGVGMMRERREGERNQLDEGETEGVGRGRERTSIILQFRNISIP